MFDRFVEQSTHGSATTVTARTSCKRAAGRRTASLQVMTHECLLLILFEIRTFIPCICGGLTRDGPVNFLRSPGHGCFLGSTHDRYIAVIDCQSPTNEGWVQLVQPECRWHLLQYVLTCLDWVCA